MLKHKFNQSHYALDPQAFPAVTLNAPVPESQSVGV